MGLAAIGLAEMEDLIAGLKTAKEDIRGDVQWLSGKTSEYLLSSEFTDSADRTAEWIDEVLPGLRRRLALAQQIERSTPGIQTEITIDEADLPTASPHEARESADEVADKIAEYLESDDHSEIPPEILRELENHTGDPYFDEHLAKTISPEDLGRFIELMGDEYHDRTHETARDIGTDVEYEVQPSDDDKKFAEAYGAIAEHLGISIGNSSFSWSNEQRIAWTQQFGPGAVAERSPGKYEERAFSSELGWLMTFGIWSPQTVEETVYDTYASEQFVGKGSESWPGFTLPNGEEFHDPMAGALVQVSKNPELAQKLFDPDAIRHDGMYMFRTVEEVEDGYGYVKEESRTATTRNLLEYLLVRDWNDEGAALQASLGAAIGPDAPDFDTAQRISGRLDTIAEEMEKAAEEAEKENSGPMAWVHTALDVLGLVPVVGELFDGLNGLIYTAEGDFVNAGLSYAGMIPFVGWGSTAAKGIKGAEALTSMRAAREVAENAADVSRAAGKSADDLAIDTSKHYGHMPPQYDAPIGPRPGTNSPGSSISIDKPWKSAADVEFDASDGDDVLEWASKNVTANPKDYPYGSAEHFAASALAASRKSGAGKFDYDSFASGYDKKFIDNKKGGEFEQQWRDANEDTFRLNDPSSNWTKPVEGTKDGGVPVAPGKGQDNPTGYDAKDKRYFDAVNVEDKIAYELKSGNRPEDLLKTKKNKDGVSQWDKDQALAADGWDITYVFANDPGPNVKKKLLDAGIGYQVTNTTFS
ncbi:hypothetical protein [Brevibacterium samyangense]|uniref:Uncharacterized protein n=1 Tax=Brevibacterium samyangense TaxID=366888 RepID=A0ABP5EJY7_9MICO